MTRGARYPLVLAVWLSSRGFAFVLFEAPESPFDWGMRHFRQIDKNERSAQAIAALVTRYDPAVLVLEDTTIARCGRCRRVRELSNSLRHLADAQGVRVAAYARADIRDVFASFNATTKYEIAVAVARLIRAF